MKNVVFDLFFVNNDMHADEMRHALICLAFVLIAWRLFALRASCV
ncbi:hypothetical protein [Marivita sp. S0852]